MLIYASSIQISIYTLSTISSPFENPLHNFQTFQSGFKETDNRGSITVWRLGEFGFIYFLEYSYCMKISVVYGFSMLHGYGKLE